MKRLYLIRHAKAIPGDEDKERPLSKSGQKQMKVLRSTQSRLFKSLDLILCSTAQRTLETLDGMRTCLSKHVVIQYLDILYNSSPEIFLNKLSLVDDRFDRVMIIGHNPEMTDFALKVCEFGDKKLKESMPKGSIAEFSIKNKSWAQLTYGDLKFIQLII